MSTRTHPQSGRRGLLTAGLSVAAAIAATTIHAAPVLAAVAPSPDAKLIALCFKHVEAHIHANECLAAFEATDQQDLELENVWERAFNGEQEIAEQIRHILPKTQEGLLAKAQSIALVLVGAHGPNPNLNWVEECTCSIVRDVIAMGRTV